MVLPGVMPSVFDVTKKKQAQVKIPSCEHDHPEHLQAHQLDIGSNGPFSFTVTVALGAYSWLLPTIMPALKPVGSSRLPGILHGRQSTMHVPRQTLQWRATSTRVTADALVDGHQYTHPQILALRQRSAEQSIGSDLREDSCRPRPQEYRYC
jgi:hypothetical protein